MKCAINWSVDHIRWEDEFSKIQKSNLLQSSYYASAMFALRGQKLKRGIILIDGQETGLVQILEAGLLWDAIHAVILDRGPLWFDGFGGAAHVQAFFQEFEKQFPNRFGRKRRILPEIENGQTIQKILAQLGLKRKENQKGYETIWLDITKEEDILKSSMRKNWRGALNKAQRSNMDVEWDHDGHLLNWMIQHYAIDKKIRGFSGPAPQSVRKIAEFAVQSQQCLMGKACLNGEDIAGVLILCHGNSATYQVGWTSDTGRSVSANHLLLWQAINVLKNQGIQNFDLGGVNDESAKGVKEFKEGLGGQSIQLVGHYI